MRIVVVDDEPKIRNGIGRLLERKEGIQLVGIFESARETLDFLDAEPVDVLITDIRMPDISGLEMIREIRKRNGELYIIIISGFSDFSYAQKAIEFGVTRYLTKPTDPEELMLLMEEIGRELRRKEKEFFGGAEESSGRALLVRKAVHYIDMHYGQKLSLREISEQLYITPNYLCEIFKRQMNRTISDYIMEVRMEQAKRLLPDLEYRISDVAELVGFPDPKYFSSSFKKYTHMSPLEFRNRPEMC